MPFDPWRDDLRGWRLAVVLIDAAAFALLFTATSLSLRIVAGAVLLIGAIPGVRAAIHEVREWDRASGPRNRQAESRRKDTEPG